MNFEGYMLLQLSILLGTKKLYSQLFLRLTPWGPAVCVRLREMSVLQRVK